MGCLPDEMVLEGSLLSALHRLELGRSKIGREVVVMQAHECRATDGLSLQMHEVWSVNSALPETVTSTPPAAGKKSTLFALHEPSMLSLCSCVTALQMGSGAPPLRPAHHSTSRAHAAPAAAEFWVEPPDTNLVAESALEGAATPRGSAPMIFWASSPESQRDLLSIYQSHTESEAQPPNGANTGVASW